jgi:nuclear transport factor 2 (NTF2) superfamily protein
MNVLQLVDFSTIGSPGQRAHRSVQPRGDLARPADTFASLAHAALDTPVPVQEDRVVTHPHDRREAAMTHDGDQLDDFARRYTEAWCSQEPTRVAAHYATSGSLTINGGTPSVGREAITDAARSFMVAFPDLQVLMDDVRAKGDQAVYRWTLLGTNTGPGGTGGSIRISGFEEWTFDDGGLIAKSLGHFDQSEYDRQLEPVTGYEPPSTESGRARSEPATARWFGATAS